MALSDKFKTEKRTPPVTLIHGPPGSWKTQFGCDAPNPLYFNLENSLGPRAEKVSSFTPETFADIIQTMREIYKDAEGHGAVVVDSMDHLLPLIDTDICKARGIPDIKLLVKQDGFGADGVAQAKHLKLFMSACSAVASKGVWVILIAHSQLREAANPTGDSFTRWEPKLPKKANEVMVELSECIGYSSQRVVIKDVDDKERKIGIVGDKDFYLTLNPQPGIVAKNRDKLPDNIRTTWADFIAAYENANKATA